MRQHQEIKESSKIKKRKFLIDLLDVDNRKMSVDHGASRPDAIQDTINKIKSSPLQAPSAYTDELEQSLDKINQLISSGNRGAEALQTTLSNVLSMIHDHMKNLEDCKKSSTDSNKRKRLAPETEGGGAERCEYPDQMKESATKHVKNDREILTVDVRIQAIKKDFVLEATRCKTDNAGGRSFVFKHLWDPQVEASILMSELLTLRVILHIKQNDLIGVKKCGMSLLRFKMDDLYPDISCVSEENLTIKRTNKGDLTGTYKKLMMVDMDKNVHEDKTSAEHAFTVIPKFLKAADGSWVIYTCEIVLPKDVNYFEESPDLQKALEMLFNEST